MVEIDGPGEPDLDLDPDHIGEEQVLAAPPRSSPSANSIETSGTEWWPPITPLKSSKSRACDAVPLTSAASSALVRRAARRSAPGRTP